MEELRILVEMVTSLPSMALWVLTGFFVYKIVVVGSIYGVIRFCVGKLHDMVVNWKSVKVEKIDLDGVLITGTSYSFKLLMARVRDHRNKNWGTRLEYIHDHDIEWLSEAVTDKIKADNLEKEKRKTTEVG